MKTRTIVQVITLFCLGLLCIQPAQVQAANVATVFWYYDTPNNYIVWHVTSCENTTQENYMTPEITTTVEFEDYFEMRQVVSITNLTATEECEFKDNLWLNATNNPNPTTQSDWKFNMTETHIINKTEESLMGELPILPLDVGLDEVIGGSEFAMMLGNPFDGIFVNDTETTYYIDQNETDSLFSSQAMEFWLFNNIEMDVRAVNAMYTMTQNISMSYLMNITLDIHHRMNWSRMQMYMVQDVGMLAGEIATPILSMIMNNTSENTLVAEGTLAVWDPSTPSPPKEEPKKEPENDEESFEINGFNTMICASALLFVMADAILLKNKHKRLY